jgi:release factor glutamine methyltransferase|tara:strand:- start:815 stop:1732 length:918 start_codon:yes stop_codon:yes gene_type:complete
MSGAPAAIEDMPQGTHGGTLGDWLSGAAGRLQAAGIDSARLDARLLASFVLGWNPARVLAHPEHAPGGGEWSRLQSLLARRANREPLAVIIGKREFWGLDFAVTADTLVPRPESETLIEAALAVPGCQEGDRDADLNVIDLGTGSGCLLLALLSERPNARGLGVDLSAAALKVAAGNAAALGLEGRAEFRQSDWGRGLDGTEGRFDLILANPPYIADDEFAALEPEVSRFEPRLALSGGPDGMACYRALAPQIGPLLAPGGGAFIETGAAQAGAVSALFEENGLAVTSIHADLCGRPRVVEAQQV